MPARIKPDPSGRTIPGRLVKLLRLHDVSSGQVAAARRPVVPTHAAGTTNHARQHVPRSAQA